MENTSVRSMTGFGAAVCEKEDYKITIEVKSVNNRYKDVSAHLPAGLRTLEPLINDHLNKYSLRGKIDIYVNIYYDVYWIVFLQIWHPMNYYTL